MASQSLADGRQLCVFADDAQMAQQLVKEVTAAAKENIAKKGSALVSDVGGQNLWGESGRMKMDGVGKAAGFMGIEY